MKHLAIIKCDEEGNITVLSVLNNETLSPNDKELGTQVRKALNNSDGE